VLVGEKCFIIVDIDLVLFLLQSKNVLEMFVLPIVRKRMSKVKEDKVKGQGILKEILG